MSLILKPSNAQTILSAEKPVPHALPAPVLVESFTPADITAEHLTSLGFMLSNPSPTALTGVAFTDTLNTGLQVANPNAFTSNCTAGSSVGSVIAPVSGTLISVMDASLAPNGTCTFSVNVLGFLAISSYLNTTSSVTSTNGGIGASAFARVSVFFRPGLSKNRSSPQLSS